MLVGNQLDLAHGTKERKVKKREEKKRTGLRAQTSRIWSSVGGAVRRREGSPRRKMRPDLRNRLVFVRCFPTRGRVTFSSAAAAAAASVWTRPAGAGHIRVAPRAAVGQLSICARAYDANRLLMRCVQVATTMLRDRAATLQITTTTQARF